MRNWMFGCVALAGLAFVPTAQAQFNAGDKEFTFGGTGGNDRDFDGATFGASGSIGYFFTDALELSLRQSVTFSDISAGGSQLNGSTRVALDYHFDLDRFQPFIGANIGYVYGDGANDTFEAAPEAGIKYFLNSTTFIYGLAEYQFFFDKGDQADEAFDEGQFVYTFGLGLRF